MNILCKTKENFPTEVVEMLDEADIFGVDTNSHLNLIVKNVREKMVPIYYIGIHGKIHEYKEK